MEEFNILLETLRRENESLRAQKSLEPIVSLPAKFDGNRALCRSFISQVRLIFKLQPNRYPDDSTKIGFIGTLLAGTAAVWFAPLFEQNSPILQDLTLFLKEFERTFGEYDRKSVAANKIHALKQGRKSASEYAAEFRQISCDLPWGEAALVDLFLRGLNDDIKDLLLIFPVPENLHDAISSAVSCDLRLSQRHSEKRRRPAFEPIINHPATSVVPMELDLVQQKSQLKGPLSPEERRRRMLNNLCLYCGNPGHVLLECPVRRSRKPLNSRVRLQKVE